MSVCQNGHFYDIHKDFAIIRIGTVRNMEDLIDGKGVATWYNLKYWTIRKQAFYRGCSYYVKKCGKHAYRLYETEKAYDKKAHHSVVSKNSIIIYDPDVEGNVFRYGGKVYTLNADGFTFTVTQ